MTEPDSSTEPKRVFVADDDSTIVMLLEMALQMEGYDVSCHASADELIAAIDRAEAPPHLIVTDFHLGEATGLDLIRMARERFPAVKTVLLSGSKQSTALSECSVKPDAFLGKPVDVETLTATLGALFADG